jgi:hypothetical protein
MTALQRFRAKISFALMAAPAPWLWSFGGRRMAGMMSDFKNTGLGFRH